MPLRKQLLWPKHQLTPFFDTLGRKCVGFEILRTPTLEGKVLKDEIMRQVFMDIQGLQYKLEDTRSRIANETVFSISGN
jgi:hypothetical protein